MPLRVGSSGLWWWNGWLPRRVSAGIAGRLAGSGALRNMLPRAACLIEAEEVHGGSIALIDCTAAAVLRSSVNRRGGGEQKRLHTCLPADDVGAGGLAHCPTQVAPPIKAGGNGKGISREARNRWHPARQGGETHETPVNIAGCDALLTRLSGVALLVRTADCLPLFVCDPIRWVIGLAHVGWRGLEGKLPLRLIGFMRQMFQSHAQDLRFAIGPAIRACCYDVGPEFESRFGGYVRQRSGRLTCDLIGATVDQLRQAGVRKELLVDSGHCTACEPENWWSRRRDGQSTGRLLSMIMLRP